MHGLNHEEQDELRALSHDATVFFAGCACALSFALGLSIEPSPAGGTAGTEAAHQFLTDIGVPFSTMVAALLGGLGYLTLRRRASVVAACAQRSRSLEPEIPCGEATAPGIVSAAREPARSLFRW